MQQKTSSIPYVVERLERLKSSAARSWQELAADLEVTYQTLYLIKTGQMGVSAKFERRLREAESKAGLKAPAPANSLKAVAARHGVKGEAAEAFEIFVRALASMPPEVQEAWAYREMFLELRETYRKSPVAGRNLLESALSVVFPQHHAELMKWLNSK